MLQPLLCLGHTAFCICRDGQLVTLMPVCIDLMRSAYSSHSLRCVQSLRGWADGCSRLDLSQQCQKQNYAAEVQQERTETWSTFPVCWNRSTNNSLKGNFETIVLAGTANLNVSSQAACLPCTAAARASQVCKHEVLLRPRTLSLSWKVEGSMLGKSLSATGSRNSMKGTTTKMMKGSRRNTSAVVRVSCRRSRLQAALKTAQATAAARERPLIDYDQMPLPPAGLLHSTVDICQMHLSLQAAAASAARSAQHHRRCSRARLQDRDCMTHD